MNTNTCNGFYNDTASQRRYNINSSVKRCLSCLLIICITLAIFPLMGLQVNAATEIYVGGVRMEDNTYLATNATQTTTEKPSEGYAYFDANSNKLTLDGYQYSGQGLKFETNGRYSVIYYSQLLNLEIKGNNSIIQTGEVARSYGICASGITITGDGILNVTSSSAKNFSIGIRVENNLVIESGTVTVSGNESDEYSYGLYSNSGDIIINGGIVNVSCGDSGLSSRGFYAYEGNVTINGGNITVTGGNAAGESSAGIAAGNDITIVNAELNTSSKTSLEYSYGMISYKGSISITDSGVTAVGGESTGSSFAITSYKDIIISGETVNATSSAADKYSIAIDSDEGNVQITDAKVTAVGGTTRDDNSYGIYAQTDIIITGSELTASGGAWGRYNAGLNAYDGKIAMDDSFITVSSSAGGMYSYGMESNTDIIINGCTVNCVSSEATYYSIAACVRVNDMTITDSDCVFTGGTALENNSYGICSTRNLLITGSKVEATGGDAKYYTSGLYTENDIVITDSDVIAIGGTAEDTSTGIFCTNSVTIKGNTVRSQGVYADMYSCGIYAENYLSIESGAVISLCDGTSGEYSAIYNELVISGYVTDYGWRTESEAEYSTDDFVNEIGYTYVEINPVHIHSAQSEWESDVTTHWKLCTCGEKMNTAGHSYGEWSDTTPATPAKAGIRTRVCTVCGYTETAVIDATGEKPTIAIWIIVIVIVLLGAATAVFFIIKNKKKKDFSDEFQNANRDS